MLQDYGFNDREFDRLRDLVFQYTGIHLSEDKKDLVYNRFAKRLRNLSLKTFDEYYDYVHDNKDIEIEHFSNAITTNLTSFFRENHHFEVLANEILPKLSKKPDKKIRIWSAGCSTGEEPYSIAITLLENFINIEQWDVKILATDLDSNVLTTASQGVYPISRLENVPESTSHRWFEQDAQLKKDSKTRVKQKVRSLIIFKQLNLMHDFPMKGPLDIIFCRNVVIYFDKPTQSQLFEKIAKLQPLGANLIVGHSENLSKVTSQYEHMGQTVYQRI